MGILWALVIILFIAWLLGAFAFHYGILIHTLLVIVVILVVVGVVTARSD
jgi:hypothetical protein